MVNHNNHPQGPLSNVTSFIGKLRLTSVHGSQTSFIQIVKKPDTEAAMQLSSSAVGSHPSQCGHLCQPTGLWRVNLIHWMKARVFSKSGWVTARSWKIPRFQLISQMGVCCYHKYYISQGSQWKRKKLNAYTYSHVYIHTYMHTYMCVYIVDDINIWSRERENQGGGEREIKELPNVIVIMWSHCVSK
jgi:hypothetical protein